MAELTIELKIYSPRRGHEDIYSFEISREELVINLHAGARSAKATYRENYDPEWTGEPLENMLRNDSIYPPTNFNKLIEHVWLSWRSEGLSSERVEKELQALIDWLNFITKNKPSTEFWTSYF